MISIARWPTFGFSNASREGCRMSKRRMLELFEVKNGRGRPNLVVALPGQLHSQSGSQLPGRPRNRPVQEHWSEDLVKLIGGPLLRSLGHPAALANSGAQKHGTPGCW